MNSDNSKLFISVIMLIFLILIFATSINNIVWVQNEDLGVIQFTHSKVHNGELWYIKNNTVLGSGDNYTISLETGDEKIHFVYEIENSQETEYIFCENANISSNGSLVQELNRNRNYNNGTTTKFYINSILADCNKELSDYIEGAGKKVGGVIKERNEKILKPNTTYAIYIKNRETTENIINYYFEFYEGHR